MFMSAYPTFPPPHPAPTVSQFYVVPAPGDDDKLLDSPNVCAVYSMWMHFLDALEQLQQQIQRVENELNMCVAR